MAANQTRFAEIHKLYYQHNDALDNLLGSLEVAIDLYDRQSEQERAIADERAANPNFNPPRVTCEHCKKMFPLSKWFAEIHTQRCKKEHTKAEVESSQRELKCPHCKVRWQRHQLMAHFGVLGPDECREYWRALSVVEKFSVFPEFYFDRYAAILRILQGPEPQVEGENRTGRLTQDDADTNISAQDIPVRVKTELRSMMSSAAHTTINMADSTGPSNQDPASALKRKRLTGYNTLYCLNCGTSIMGETWFLSVHLKPCIARAMAAGTLYSYDPLTGQRMEDVDAGEIEHAAQRPRI